MSYVGTGRLGPGLLRGVPVRQLSQAGSDFQLSRYNPDGTLDTSFNATGKITVSIPNYSSASVQG